MNRTLMTFAATAVFVAIAIYLVMNVQTFMGRLVVAACVGTVLLLKPQAALIGAIVSAPMELHLPGFAGIFRLHHFFLFALFAYGILDTALRKSSARRYASARYLLGFAAVLAVIIAFRGIGFRVLGSEAFGGADYIKIFLAIGGYWGGLKVAIRAKTAKWVVVLFALAPLVPTTAQILVSRWPTLFYVLQRFIETRVQYVLSEAELYGMRGVTGGIGRRLHAAAHLATGVWILLWGRWGMAEGGRRTLLYIALPLLAALSMLSGFRGSTASFVLLGGLCLFLTGRSKAPVLLGGAFLAAVSYIVLYVVGPQLPLAAQRALSIIPGIPWDPAAMRDAAHTITWRVEVWRYAARRLPDYLLLGRGLLLEDVYRVHAWRDWSYYSTPEFFYATHAYHSGPLSLLLDTGLFGFLTFLFFQISVVREAWRTWSRVRDLDDAFLRNVYYYLAVRVSYMLFVYYALYGDIKYNIFDWVIAALLLHQIGKVAEQVPFAKASVPEKASVPDANAVWVPSKV